MPIAMTLKSYLDDKHIQYASVQHPHTDSSVDSAKSAHIPPHQMAKAVGLGDEPRRIFDELGEISLVDVVLPTRKGPEIRRRCVRRPTDHQAILLDHLALTLPRQVKS